MKIIKRTLAVVLVLAMALTAVGCGKNGDNNGGNAGNGGSSGGKVETLPIEEYAIDSEALLASMPAELKGTTMTFLSWYDPREREEKDVLADFEKKSGIKVNCRVTSYVGYAAQVAALLAAGESPDVMRMKNPNIALLKVLQPLSVTGFDYSGKAWDKYTMGLYTVGQTQYAAALMYTPYFLPSIYFYNTSIMEDMGFEDPYELWKERKWTWSKMREMCTTWINENGADYRGAYTQNPSRNAGISLVKWNEDNIHLELDLTNQMALAAWKFSQEAKQTGMFAAVNDGFDQMNPTLLFASMDASAVQQSSGYFNKTRMHGNLKGVPAPMWDLTDDAVDYHLYMTENIGFGVPKGAKNAKAVPYFLGYVGNFANYNQGVGKGGFFFSEQIKECYMNLMSIKNRGLDQFLLMQQDATNLGTFSEDLNKTDPTQVEQWLQSREYIMQDAINEINREREALAKQK